MGLKKFQFLSCGINTHWKNSMTFKNLRLILFIDFLSLHSQTEGVAHLFQGFRSLSTGKRKKYVIKENEKQHYCRRGIL